MTAKENILYICKKSPQVKSISKCRYIAFNRVTCKEYDLFTSIENAICKISEKATEKTQTPIPDTSSAQEQNPEQL